MTFCLRGSSVVLYKYIKCITLYKNIEDCASRSEYLINCIMTAHIDHSSAGSRIIITARKGFYYCSRGTTLHESPVEISNCLNTPQE